jgi:hypothetical protein
MPGKSDVGLTALILALCAEPTARLEQRDDGRYAVNSSARARAASVSDATVRRLAVQGLLEEAQPGRFVAAPAARGWLKRQASSEHGFRAQHSDLVETCEAGDRDRKVLVNLDESPVASLARRPGKNGEPWLTADLSTAAERLRRDFEIGQLQPRVTANWSASVNDGRRTGDGAGVKDLTDMALAARLRVDRAMRAVGPELSGVLVDICCFLKGLEMVERERQWPARSAKLVLRLALASLARHYGLTAATTGKPSVGLRHWGDDGYRPEIT